MLQRRSVLKKTGALVLGSSIAAKTVSAQDAGFSDDPTLPGGPGDPGTRKARKQYLVERYGKREAAIIQTTAVQYRKRVKNGQLTRKEGYQQTIEDLIRHPQTPKVTEDIQTFEETTTDPDNTNASGATGIAPTAVGDTTTVSVTRSEMGRSGWGVWDAFQSVSVPDKRMSTNARVSAIGGANSYTRLYGRITPNSSIGGTVRLTSTYYRLGNVVGGNAVVYLFVRETARPSTTLVRNPVEFPGGVNGTVTKSTQLTLPAGVQHDVGIELETSVNTIVAGYFYADFYFTDALGNQRRLVLQNPIQIESLD